MFATKSLALVAIGAAIGAAEFSTQGVVFINITANVPNEFGRVKNSTLPPVNLGPVAQSFNSFEAKSLYLVGSEPADLLNKTVCRRFKDANGTIPGSLPFTAARGADIDTNNVSVGFIKCEVVADSSELVKKSDEPTPTASSEASKESGAEEEEEGEAEAEGEELVAPPAPGATGLVPLSGVNSTYVAPSVTSRPSSAVVMSTATAGYDVSTMTSSVTAMNPTHTSTPPPQSTPTGAAGSNSLAWSYMGLAAAAGAAVAAL